MLVSEPIRIGIRSLADARDGAAMRERYLEPAATSDVYIVDMTEVDFLEPEAAAAGFNPWLEGLRANSDTSPVLILARDPHVLAALDAGMSDPDKAAYGVLLDQHGTVLRQLAIGDITEDDEGLIEMVSRAGPEGLTPGDLERRLREELSWDTPRIKLRRKKAIRNALLITTQRGRYVVPRYERQVPRHERQSALAAS